MMKRSEIDRLRGADNAVYLLSWLKLVCHPDDRVHPSRAEIAVALGPPGQPRSLSWLTRAMAVLTAEPALVRVHYRADRHGNREGCYYEFLELPVSEASDPRLHVTGDVKDVPHLHVTGDVKDAPNTPPTRQNQPHLHVTSDVCTSDQIKRDQISTGVVIEHRGYKQQAALASRPAQQQHAPPGRDEEPGGSPPVPPDESSPTPAEFLAGFYTFWQQAHDAPYDQRPEADQAFAVFILTAAGDRAFDAIEAFFKCTDVRIIGRDGMHPLGLLKANIGRLLAKPARARPKWCDHDPTCRSATQHRDRIIAEGRAERLIEDLRAADVAAAAGGMRH